MRRIEDVRNEPLQKLPPILGYEKLPVVSLAEAVKPLINLVSDVERMVYHATDGRDKPMDNLTADQSAAIRLYTLQWDPPEKSFYHILNATLRIADREKLKPWFSLS